MRIRLEHLEKEFDGVPVLRGIDFDDDVTTLAVIGPSGGGKSTLLRIVGGLIAPTAGTVEVDGERVDFDERTLPAYRASLGFVFQASGLFHHLGALENVALPLSVVHGVPEDLSFLADGTADVVISNCTFNLSPDKGAYIAEVKRILKPQGEWYFTDVFTDRRIPQETSDKVENVAMRLGGAAAGYDGKNAWRIFRRDRKRHKSPNSAHTEAACAGALQLQLAGPNYYFGQLVDKPTIGDDQRPVEALDILRAGRILYATAFFALLLFCGVPLLILLFP